MHYCQDFNYSTNGGPPKYGNRNYGDPSVQPNKMAPKWAAEGAENRIPFVNQPPSSGDDSSQGFGHWNKMTLSNMRQQPNKTAHWASGVGQQMTVHMANYSKNFPQNGDARSNFYGTGYMSTHQQFHDPSMINNEVNFMYPQTPQVWSSQTAGNSLPPNAMTSSRSRFSNTNSYEVPPPGFASNRMSMGMPTNVQQFANQVPPVPQNFMGIPPAIPLRPGHPSNFMSSNFMAPDESMFWNKATLANTTADKKMRPDIGTSIWGDPSKQNDQPIRYWQQYSEDCFEGSGGSRRASSMSRNVSDDGASEMKSTSTTMVSNGWDNFPVSTKAVSKPSHSNNFMATSSTDTATSVISKPQNGAGMSLAEELCSMSIGDIRAAPLYGGENKSIW